MLTPVDIADATASAAADAEETDRVKRTELAQRQREFFLSLLVGGCGLPESLCEAFCWCIFSRIILADW